MMFLESLNIAENQCMFQGQVIKYNIRSKVESELLLSEFIDNLLLNLNERFSQMDKLKKLKFLLPAYVPDCTSGSFSEYGNNDIKEVHQHFTRPCFHSGPVRL